MIDDALLVLAASQGELFGRTDVLAAGIHPTQLRSWVKERRCRPVIRGIYSTRPAPPRDRDERLLEKTHAMLLSNPGVAAAGRSALILHGIDTHGVNYDRAQGVWLNGCATRSTECVIIRRPLVRPEVVQVGRWPSVAPSWAVVDVARDAGVLPGVVSADSALHQDLLTRAALADVIDALPRSHRIGRAARMFALMDGRSESAGESITRLILRRAGFDIEPQFRIEVNGRLIARPDFRVRGTRLLIEFDGMVKYKGENGAKALQEEKIREDMLRRLGWSFVRLIWPDLDHPAMIVSRVRSALSDLAA
ncbi:type IV toxin-antitoxin system AbiEi family antitoxin domain-containing protein [Luteipulveratus flavus]|uniref:DUF559 domain-containing protein n=1 Tax=Luteipulveratus flavus TaxID=3031728 RepID=A0ABT6CB20_9MICO|nr:type IV toxin-antitoxin system AbiEi family antitoxin domain-containing protein [Luteipulveratus sp. YIM 133296]MDF8265527.1 hypothetical protein [Luteipulveratus sp. YIM 133296]